MIKTKFAIAIILLFIFGCSPDIPDKPYPCLDGNCDGNYWIKQDSQPYAYLDDNAYWHVYHMGINYFSIKGELDELNEHYVINGVPLMEVAFDSDYWVWIDNIQFTVPVYSYLGYFTSGDFNNPIPIGNISYTLEDMAEIYPPLNIVGYSINPNQCMDCPYSETLLGTYSKYTYEPQQNIFFDNEMVGDTAKVIIKTTLNSDAGPRVEKEDIMNIVFEEL